MPVHPPRRRQLLPPTPEEQARRAEEAATWRAERDRRDAELRPACLAAVCSGPPVRDPDKAADCLCGCHPKPADAELHDGGLSCGCQLTPEEREQSWKEFTAELDSLDLDSSGGSSRRRSSSPGTSTGAASTCANATGITASRSCRMTIQPPTDPRHLFCSWCGVRLTEADQWTTV